MPVHHPPRQRFTVRPASWQGDSDALCQIREQVFIREQRVPEALEWDGEDEAAQHLLAEDGNGRPIGTARLLGDGHIGRVAVLPDWRHLGVGTALVDAVLRLAVERGFREAYLDAQLEALAFYRQLGFRAEGEVFMDAGIPHRRMRRNLDT